MYINNEIKKLQNKIGQLKDQGNQQNKIMKIMDQIAKLEEEGEANKNIEYNEIWASKNNGKFCRYWGLEANYGDVVYEMDGVIKQFLAMCGENYDGNLYHIKLKSEQGDELFAHGIKWEENTPSDADFDANFDNDIYLNDDISAIYRAFVNIEIDDVDNDDNVEFVGDKFIIKLEYKGNYFYAEGKNENNNKSKFDNIHAMNRDGSRNVLVHGNNHPFKNIKI